jgi:hypothetical protein
MGTVGAIDAVLSQKPPQQQEQCEQSAQSNIRVKIKSLDT